MPRLALEYLFAIAITVTVSFRLIKLNADPVALVFAFNFANILNDTLFAFVFKWYELDPLTDLKVCLRHIR